MPTVNNRGRLFCVTTYPAETPRAICELHVMQCEDLRLPLASDRRHPVQKIA
jgi:hypothetical protein